MSVDDLKRRQATLEAVHLDLPRWDLGRAENAAPFESRPVVAVDWSEIFCFITREPPREDYGEDSFAAHYAGLNYLLYTLPCRLVLLPPYATEMTNSLEAVKTQALSMRLPLQPLQKKYSALLEDLAAVCKDNPRFYDVLKGDWTVMDDLQEPAWSFLDRVLTDHLPSVYLDVQERTVTAMRALKLLLRADDCGHRRIQLLPALNIVPEKASQDVARGWEDWASEMDLQRPEAGRRNRADSLALCYLQTLHQAFYWRDVPVYFASRSLSMLRVMEDHAGEFEPYAQTARQSMRTIQSSWRPWEYFAELGYYSSKFRTTNGQKWSDNLAGVARDLVDRKAKLDQRIVHAKDTGQSHLGITDKFSDWETLRGSFDLDGMAVQEHWNQIQRPRESLLVQLLSSVLSESNSTSFLLRRGSLAQRVLKEVEEILADLPHEIWSGADPNSEEHDPGGSLVEIVGEHLKLGPLFEAHAERRVKPEHREQAQQVAALVRGLSKRSNRERIRAANGLLTMMGDAAMRQSFIPSLRDWLTGVALVYGARYEQSLSYLPAWLEAHSSSASVGLGLATRALSAEAYRQRRESDAGMRLLLDVQPDIVSSMTDSEMLIWQCLKAQLLIDWIERVKENFEIFPKPAGKSGETEIIAPMIESVANVVSKSNLTPLKLQQRAANTILFLIARYIPEYARTFTGDERKQKLRWLLDRTNHVELIAGWFAKRMADAPTPPYLYTLGYFNGKMYLATRSNQYVEKAKSFLKEAKDRAEATGDTTTARLVGETLHWAAVKVLAARQ